MNLLATTANLAWLGSSLPSAWTFEHALLRPEETQERLLSRQLRCNARSLFGREHGFDDIRSYADFAKRVPIRGYDELEPWIKRIQAGERSVLTTEPVTHLVPTSGSSGARKLIPFTAGLQREFNAAIAPWITDLSRQHPAIIRGPAYWSVTPLMRDDRRTPSAVPIGFDDDSQYLGGFRRQFVEAVMAAPSSLRHVTDPGTFRYLLLLCLLRQRDLRLISVWHPSFLSLLLDELPKIWQDLLSDIRNGTCSVHERHLPSSLLQTVRRFGPKPERAAELQCADPCRPSSLWPFLRVISCWCDAHARLAADELARRFPRVSIQPKGLLATEAFVTIPFSGAHPLAIRSHFFEFIAADDNVLPAHALQDGETYELVVTTSGGLWRYRLGDRVRVSGFLGRTPSLSFLGRAGHVSDLCGEKLSGIFVAEVIAGVCSDLGEPVHFAMLAPERTERGWRYALFLEGKASADVAEKIDLLLRQNPHYACCRDLGQLLPVRLFLIRGGGYETFVSAEVTAGRRMGEVKPTALSARTDWARCFEAVAED
jgi:hypothetical protein